MPTKFATDTAVNRVDEDRYEARISPDWFIGSQPNGGYVAAIVMRALVARVDDADRTPRTFTVHYLRPPSEGAVIVDVSVVRSGRTVTTLTARMIQDGKAMAQVMAAFATARQGAVHFADAVMPAVPAPEQVGQRPTGERAVSLRARFDNRWVIGTDGADGLARTGAWLRLSDPQPVDAVLVAQLMDCWMPSVFVKATERGAVHGPNVPTVEMTIHLRAPLPQPDDFYLGEFHTDVARDGFITEDGRLWSRDGVLVAESRQLAIMTF